MSAISSLERFDHIADRIKLARQADFRRVAVVEGVSDEAFLSRVLSEWDLAVYVATTRAIVLDTARDCYDLGISRVACLVDRDFDDTVAAAEVEPWPVAAYDNADLEAMLWSSVTLDFLINEIGSRDKLVQFGGVAMLRDRTHEILAPLSRLRYESARLRWGLNFDRIDLASKLNLRTLNLNVQSLCDALWSSDLPVAKEELYRVASAEDIVPMCPHTGLPLLRGRDALAVLGVALRRLIGNFTNAQAVPERLEEALRLTANIQMVRQTHWYNSVSGLLAESAGPTGSLDLGT